MKQADLNRFGHAVEVKQSSSLRLSWLRLLSKPTQEVDVKNWCGGVEGVIKQVATTRPVFLAS